VAVARSRVLVLSNPEFPQHDLSLFVTEFVLLERFLRRELSNEPYVKGLSGI
jgi:hypothetical protein